MKKLILSYTERGSPSDCQKMPVELTEHSKINLMNQETNRPAICKKHLRNY